MSDEMSNMASDPQHRRQFEKLLRLAAKRGDADLVAERLGWGIDPNCRTSGGGAGTRHSHCLTVFGLFLPFPLCSGIARR